MKAKGKENLVSPRATRSAKRKHYLSRFVREMKLGSVRKSSLTEIRASIAEIGMNRDSTITVRPLGPERFLGLQASQESLRSVETYFVEANQSESELTLLQESLRKQESLCSTKQASISRLEAQVSVLTKELAIVKTQVEFLTTEKANSVYSFSDEDKFSTVGMQMSIRSLIDHILSTIYVRAGLVGVNAKTGLVYSDSDLADWLRGPKVPLLFQGGNFVTLFGVEVVLDVSLLTVLGSCKSISSGISRKHAHSSQPVLVAAALNNLQYKEDHDLGKLFKSIFQYSFTQVVKKHETGCLTEGEATRLEKRFFSRI